MVSNGDHGVKFSAAISSVSEQTLRSAKEIHEAKTKEFWDGWHKRRRARNRKRREDQHIFPVTVSYKETPLSILSPELRAAVLRECMAQGIRADEVIVINSTTVEFP